MFRSVFGEVNSCGGDRDRIWGGERDSGVLNVGKSHDMACEDCFTANGTRVSSFALVLDVGHK